MVQSFCISSQKLIRSLADIAEHICQIKRSDGNFFLKCANEHFFVSGQSNQRVDCMGIKVSPKQFPVVCDGYVKYEEAEVDRLVAILKTNNCGSGPCGIQ